MRLLYRARQLWHALTASPTDAELAEVRHFLDPRLWALFLRLQPSEQVHSLRIYHQLREQNETSVDLFVAALLHDVGKTCHPLSLWERATIVLGKAFFPERVRAWGDNEPRGWRRPFVVSEQHPNWGADLAAAAGASPSTVSIIRHHQSSPERLKAYLEPCFAGKPGCLVIEFSEHELQLLSRLQNLDDES